MPGWLCAVNNKPKPPLYACLGYPGGDGTAWYVILSHTSLQQYAGSVVERIDITITRTMNECTTPRRRPSFPLDSIRRPSPPLLIRCDGLLANRGGLVHHSSPDARCTTPHTHPTARMHQRRCEKPGNSSMTKHTCPSPAAIIIIIIIIAVHRDRVLTISHG